MMFRKKMPLKKPVLTQPAGVSAPLARPVVRAMPVKPAPAVAPQLNPGVAAQPIKNRLIKKKPSPRMSGYPAPARVA